MYNYYLFMIMIYTKEPPKIVSWTGLNEDSTNPSGVDPFPTGAFSLTTSSSKDNYLGGFIATISRSFFGWVGVCFTILTFCFTSPVELRYKRTYATKTANMPKIGVV